MSAFTPNRSTSVAVLAALLAVLAALSAVTGGPARAVFLVLMLAVMVGLGATVGRKRRP